MQCAVFNFSLPTVSPISFSRFLGCLWYYQAVEFPFTKSFTVGNSFLLFTPLHQCAVTWNFTFKDFPPPDPRAINSIFCLTSWNTESHLLHSFSSRWLPGTKQLSWGQRVLLSCMSSKLPCLSSSNRGYFMFSRVDQMGVFSVQLVTEQLLGLSWTVCRLSGMALSELQ